MKKIELIKWPGTLAEVEEEARMLSAQERAQRNGCLG
jgi:hypothetical protein